MANKEEYMNNDALIRLMTDYMRGENIDQSELARRLEVSAPTMTNWLNGKHGITKKNAAAIEYICRKYAKPEPKSSDVRPITSAGMEVPLISSAAAATCNPGMQPLLECVNQYSEEKVVFKQAKPGDFAIEVKGTSMSPWYPEGTLLLVRPYQDLRNGQRVVVVLDEGEIIFKIYAEKGNKICLFSISGEGRDYIFTKPRVPIRYICRVIASIRNEDDLDEEMSRQNIVHDWQVKLSEVE